MHKLCVETRILTKLRTRKKLLGLNWDTISDEFVFEMTSYAAFASSQPLTERTALRIIAKMYVLD